MTAWTLLGLVLSAASLAQNPPPQADLSQQVGALVRRLDADQQDVRDQAEQALLDLGPKVLPLLETPPRASAEVEVRLERIRLALQRQEVAQAARASRVTLRADELPLSEVLSALSRQSGNTLRDFRAEFGQQAHDPKLTLHLEEVPFWRALDEVLDQAQLTVYPYAGKNELTLINRGEEARPRLAAAAYAGPFRVAPRSVVATRDLTRQGDAVLQLGLEIAWEPRLQPVIVKQPLENLEAVDDRGEALAVATPEAVLESQVQSGLCIAGLQMQWSAPPRTAKTIARLRGEMQVVLPGPPHSFRFTQLDQPGRKQQRRGAATVFIDRVVKNNNVWQVHTRVRFEEAFGALESHRDWFTHLQPVLLSPEGESVALAGWVGPGLGQREFSIVYNFALPGGIAGHTFVFEAPTMILEVPVAYELRDIPLP